MFDPSGYTRVRPEILAALVRYGKEAKPVGHFLQAVLANDLVDAITRADHMNLPVIRDIVLFAQNELPAECHGSRAAYQRWLQVGPH